MAKCRKGDLAIIIAPFIPENLGTFVEVLRLTRLTPRRWWVRSLSGPKLRSDGSIGLEGNVAESGLKPIRGDHPARRGKNRKKNSRTPVSHDLTGHHPKKRSRVIA